MAATATPTTTARGEDDEGIRDASAQAATPVDASADGFDDLFVQPVDPDSGRGDVASLPSGWRHARLVEVVARQPRERRETILAGAFALTAVLWAPLGVLAFMTRNGLLFGVLSLAAVALAVAPRPATVSEAVGELADRAAPALDRVGPAAASLRERLAPVAARLRERVAWVATHLRERLEPLGPRLREAGDRAVAFLRDVGQRAAVRLRSADRSVSTAVRRGLEGLHAGGGRDHSTPSSAR